MNDDFLIDRIRALSRPLEALPTNESPRLQRLPSVAAVVFDIYGTLMISGCGEVGTAAAVDAPSAIRHALSSMQIDASHLAPDASLEPTIRRMHEQSVADGVDYPEVDILEVWREALGTWVSTDQLPDDALSCNVRQLAIEYECRANPVWPMPNADLCINAMREHRVLGIVSNAQFYTPLLFPALMMQNVDDLGFSGDMQYYSYRCRVAKPSLKMFQLTLAALRERGILAGQCLYVGNDMLNDVTAAGKVGMKTALFAGDARSLRWREGDPRVDGVQPDLLITELPQLIECIL